MIPIIASIQLVASPWTLTSADGRVTLTARKLCIVADCVDTGSPKVNREGVWLFDGGVEVRWSSNVDAEVRQQGEPWKKAALTFATPSEGPPVGLDVLATAYSGPAPGRWTKETVGCDRAKPVWFFDPIIREQSTLAAYPRGSGRWSLRSGTTVVLCHDAGGQYGGVP